MEDHFSRVASLADVPDGDMKAVTGPDGVLVTLANVKGEIFCFEDMCSHEDASLHFGWLLPDICQVECPLHEGRFDLRTGSPTQAPPEYPISIYNVRVEGDDILVGPKKA
jgi:nitrite reductase/ring-hydroxylating ferredoxin subunit